MSDKGKMTEQLSQARAKISVRWKPVIGLFAASAATAFLIGLALVGFFNNNIGQLGATVRDFGLPILAIWGFCLAVWRSAIAQKQANTAAQQADIAARSLQNDRYQKGADMLGSEKLSVRVGGINALKRLAQDDPETYHCEIMALFSFFARHPTPDAELELEDVSSPEEKKKNKCRPDVEAIVQAIGQRNAEQQKLDELSMEGKGLSTIVLLGVNLRRALLFDTNLSRVLFVNSDLAGANLNGANLAGSTIGNSNLAYAELTADLTAANLEDTNLTSADFTHASLFGANLENTILTDANLEYTNLTGVNLNRVKNLTQDQLDKACQFPQGNPPHNLPKVLKWNEEEAKNRWEEAERIRKAAATREGRAAD